MLNSRRLPEKIPDLIPGLTKAESLASGFDESGYFPVGVHDHTLDSLASIVVFNEERRGQWLQFMAFLAWPVLNRRFTYAYIGGGFVSSKPSTRDIDLVLQTRSSYGPDAFTAVARFFAAGLPEIEEMYGVHLQFWMKDAPEGMRDYRAFFQYDRPDVLQHVLDPKRGIARLDLHVPGLINDLRRHMRGEGVPSFPKSHP